METEIQTIQEARVRVTTELTGDDIINMLNKAGAQIPSSAEVFVPVPGGGDYSNTDLEISEGVPITITWERGRG